MRENVKNMSSNELYEEFHVYFCTPVPKPSLYEIRYNELCHEMIKRIKQKLEFDFR